MDIRTILVSCILVSGVILAVVGFWGTLVSNYGVTNWQESGNISWVQENVSTKVTKTVEQLGGKIGNATAVGTTASESPFLVIPAVFNTLKMIFFDSPKIVLLLLSNLSELMGMPNWVLPVIGSIVTFIIVIEIISAILKYRI